MAPNTAEVLTTIGVELLRVVLVMTSESGAQMLFINTVGLIATILTSAEIAPDITSITSLLGTATGRLSC